jgi:hypothetical protein
VVAPFLIMVPMIRGMLRALTGAIPVRNREAKGMLRLAAEAGAEAEAEAEALLTPGADIRRARPGTVEEARAVVRVQLRLTVVVTTVGGSATKKRSSRRGLASGAGDGAAALPPRPRSITKSWSRPAIFETAPRSHRKGCRRARNCH